MNKIIKIYNTFASRVGIPIATSANNLLGRSVCWLIIFTFLVTSVLYKVKASLIFSSASDFILTHMSVFGTILWIIMPPILGYNYLSFLAKRYDSKGGSDE